MSKTPITDKLASEPTHLAGVDGWFAMFAHARRMESDRAELIEALERHMDYYLNDAFNASWSTAMQETKALLARMKGEA